MLGIEADLIQVEARPQRRRAGRARCSTEHAVDSVFHLAAETIVGTVARLAGRRPSRSNVRGTWTVLEACREHGVERVVCRLVRQGLRRSRRAALPRGLRAAADRAVRGVEGGRRPDRAQLLALLRAAGRRDPLREHLRRRRPQLLAPGPRGGQRGARRPRRRCCAPTARPSATSSTSRTPPPPTWRSPTRSTATRCAARRSTPAAGARHRVGEVVAMIAELAGTGVEPDIRGDRQPRRARSTASTWTRRSCASSAAGSRRSSLEEGLERTIEWYREHPDVRP